MDIQTVQEPQGLTPSSIDFDDLKPSERFARLAKTVFGVKKAELDEYLKDNPLEPQNPDASQKPPNDLVRLPTGPNRKGRSLACGETSA